jgi:hypothetical protein
MSAHTRSGVAAASPRFWQDAFRLAARLRATAKHVPSSRHHKRNCVYLDGDYSPIHYCADQEVTVASPRFWHKAFGLRVDGRGCVTSPVLLLPLTGGVLAAGKAALLLRSHRGDGDCDCGYGAACPMPLSECAYRWGPLSKDMQGVAEGNGVT